MYKAFYATIAFALALQASPIFADVKYTITQVVHPQSERKPIHLTPTAINDRGEIVGEGSIPSDNVNFGFIWEEKQGLEEFVTLEADNDITISNINNHGVVVGTIEKEDHEGLFDGSKETAFKWTRAEGLVPFDGNYSSININNKNEVVLGKFNENRKAQGYIVTLSGAMKEVRPIKAGMDFFPIAITENEYILCLYAKLPNRIYDAQENMKFCFWDYNSFLSRKYLHPEEIKGKVLLPTAMNSFGDVAYYAKNPDTFEDDVFEDTYVWFSQKKRSVKIAVQEDAEVMNIENLNVEGMNNKNNVVGTIYRKIPDNESLSQLLRKVGGWSYGFIWDETTGIQNLNNFIDPDLGIYLTACHGINNQGQIVVEGRTADKKLHVFLLTPIPVEPTPEPTPEAAPEQAPEAPAAG